MSMKGKTAEPLIDGPWRTGRSALEDLPRGAAANPLPKARAPKGAHDEKIGAFLFGMHEQDPTLGCPRFWRFI